MGLKKKLHQCGEKESTKEIVEGKNLSLGHILPYALGEGKQCRKRERNEEVRVGNVCGVIRGF
tara:strand:- start:184 stop:372 length:189 start_codon:yes stop_codon:yes gene_type:complete